MSRMPMSTSNTARFLPLALAAASLSACAVGPTFRAPRIVAPQEYLGPQVSSHSGLRAAPAASRTAARRYAQHLVLGSNPSPEWWRTFRSSALNALVASAVDHNPSLVAANARVAAARELVRAAAGRLHPQVSFVGGSGRQKVGSEVLGTLHNPSFSYVAAGAGVSYTIDYVGGIAHSVEEQRALATYRHCEARAAYLSLAGSVVQEALQAAAARTELRAAAELLSEDRRNLVLVRSAFRAGSVSRVDVVSAQSQLASDETLLPPLRQQLAVAEHALAVLTARFPAQWQPPALTLNQLTLPRRIPVSLPSSLAQRRPDILAAEAQLHAATAAVGVATANLYPHITLTAAGGWQGLVDQALFERSNAAWSLISGLTAPLFDGGTLRAERRATLDQLRASAAEYQAVVLKSFGQVADALDALQHDAEMVSAQSNALQAARARAALTRESYRAGKTGILQVLDAERQRVSARLGMLRAEAQQYYDTTQLYLALGGSAPQEAS
jgi:NodT family efflux transporter outer membrane factor (OMF) lipoprotein